MNHRILKALPLLALLTLLPLAGCGDQHHFYGVAPAPAQPIAPTGAYLYNVVMLSAQEGWATGATFNADGTAQKAMLAHYTGGSWQEVPVSTPLFSLSFTSPTDGWGVGLHGTIMHYDGTNWTAVTSPTTAILRAVVLDSATDGWAVGDQVILHYDGHTWSIAQKPSTQLLGLSLSAPGEGWAVGEFGAIYHLSGGQWASAYSPASEDLDGVTMISPTEGWAVGDNVLLHYSGGVWSFSPNPAPTTWYSASFSSATDGWASGEDGAMMHYQSGEWVADRHNYAPGYDLSSVAMVSANEGWAVGQKNIVRHYLNGAWTTYGFLP